LKRGDELSFTAARAFDPAVRRGQCGDGFFDEKGPGVVASAKAEVWCVPAIVTGFLPRKPASLREIIFDPNICRGEPASRNTNNDSRDSLRRYETRQIGRLTLGRMAK